MRIAARLVIRGRAVTKASSSATDVPGKPEFRTVEVDSMPLEPPRTVGIETAALGIEAQAGGVRKLINRTPFLQNYRLVAPFGGFLKKVIDW